MIRDEKTNVATGERIVREWDPDVSDTATVTVYDADGNVTSTHQVDVSEERQAVLAARAAESDKLTAADAFARLDQIIGADPTAVTNRQAVNAIQDLAKMVRVLGRRELAG